MIEMPKPERDDERGKERKSYHIGIWRTNSIMTHQVYVQLGKIEER